MKPTVSVCVSLCVCAHVCLFLSIRDAATAREQYTGGPLSVYVPPEAKPGQRMQARTCLNVADFDIFAMSSVGEGRGGASGGRGAGGADKLIRASGRMLKTTDGEWSGLINDAMRTAGSCSQRRCLCLFRAGGHLVE